MKMLRLALVPALGVTLGGANAAPQRVMVFPFYFDNTSLEATSAAEQSRSKMITEQLRAALESSQKYQVIPGNDTILTSQPQIGKCNDDQISTAEKAGAELAACPWVQKVSNLILNLNIVIENIKTKEFVHGGSVDIRGNTDESWEHGLRYLLREHVFGQD